MQPAINIETVINATSLDIVNDGTDGGAAIVRTCGPDDILDFVNPSTIIEDAGLEFPAFANDNDQDVEACTEYILEPDATYLKLVTTVFNNEPVATGFLVGDFINASGELEQWGSGDEGIGVRLLGDDMGVFSYFGYGEAQGVDYAITTIPIPESTQNTGYFSTSGVSYILHSQSVLNALGSQDPVFDVPAGGSKAFTRYFGVGDGSGGNAVTLENLVKGVTSGQVSGCVTVNGVPAPGARVSAGPVTAGAITRVRSTWVTGPDGCYSGTLPAPGANGFVAWRLGHDVRGRRGHPAGPHGEHQPDDSAACRISICRPPVTSTSRSSTRTATRCRRASASSASIRRPIRPSAPTPVSSSTRATSTRSASRAPSTPTPPARWTSTSSPAVTASTSRAAPSTRSSSRRSR